MSSPHIGRGEIHEDAGQIARIALCQAQLFGISEELGLLDSRVRITVIFLKGYFHDHPMRRLQCEDGADRQCSYILQSLCGQEACRDQASLQEGKGGPYCHHLSHLRNANRWPQEKGATEIYP